MIAKTFQGLENVLAQELEDLGATEVKILKRAVSFKGDTKLMYKANLYLRTALKILKPIKTFKAEDADELYKNVRKIDWEKYMSLYDTFAIESVVSSPHFTHSGFVALKTKDAIADYFRNKHDKRPSVDTEKPRLKINIHIYKDNCTISLDSSGEPLFKRGYRQETRQAPLNEVLAAGMLQLSNWDKEKTLLDPMCGSGTIVIEAALIAMEIPPCILRKEFGFELWQDFDKYIWNEIVEEAESHAKQAKLDCRILGSDTSRNALGVCKRNLDNFWFDIPIEFKTRAIEELTPPEEGGVVVCNPPYGNRVTKDDMGEFYKMIGDRLKDAFSGYSAWLISSNLPALKNVGLRPSRRITLYNGALECKFQCFEMYRGSKKQKYQNEN